MRVLAATDKFRGTATASESCAAIARAAMSVGCEVEELPLADGGEGTLIALGGANRLSIVTGPAGNAVQAGWRLHEGVAVIEMAQAAGLGLAGGATANDPWAATTRGVGELVLNALDAGAHTIIVSVGGSATTDGGRGAVDLIESRRTDLAGVQWLVAADVTTLFLSAATVFAPQKGADAETVVRLSQRLAEEATAYFESFGVDVRTLPGSGAAGGLAGGLAAIGARIVPGFDVVAQRLDLETALERADLVITGEGRLDASSLLGKVVGGVLALAAPRDQRVAVVCGVHDEGVTVDHPVLSLTRAFGAAASQHETARCIEELTARFLRGLSTRPQPPAR